MFKKVTLSLAIAGSIAGFAGNAAAGSSTNNLSVTASVSTNCAISSSAVAFGGYDPVGANATADKTGTGSVSVTCTKNSTGITVGLGLGSNASGSARRMLGGTNGDLLSYELYQPADGTPAAACAYTTVWGNAGTALLTPTGVSGWGASSAKTFNVCGNIPQAQNVSGTSAGEAYTDTVVATVNF
jgi:spore coat protein U-like protein